MRQALGAGPVSTSSSFQPIQRSRRGRSLDAPHPTDHENGQGHPTPTFGTVPATFGENGTETPRDAPGSHGQSQRRSEEHTSELQSLMRSSYAVFCLKKKQR